MGVDQNILAKPGSPHNSPSKKFVLNIEEEIVENIKYLKFFIQNKQNGRVFNSKELFDIRHNTYFLWDDSDNVWVYSGDVGTYVWQHKQSNWVRKHYLEIDSLPPDFLLNKYPKKFIKLK